MSQWDGKSKGHPLGYRIFIYLLQKAGIQAAYGLLYVVAAYYFLFLWKKTGIMYAFFRRHIGWSPLRSLLSVYKNYVLLGQCLIDKTAVMAGVKTHFTFHFDGEQYLHEAASNGCGMILLGAHLGNWEMAGHYLYRIALPVNIVVYDNEYQKIKMHLDKFTGKKNFNIIAIKDDFSHLYEITEALNRNEIVCMHGDRCMEPFAVEPVRFINDTANFPQRVFKLCAVLQVPVTFVYAMKKGRNQYYFHATAPKTYDKHTWHDLLYDYVNHLEAQTRQYALHWFNYYNFWAK